ncbi:hypothetical protein StoSoilB5_21250 [Arthrobacter sp. StoSoilB5]|nr:hypothetical protein StoSoilB5_21250 [Arthrobacter sp. StoSoilB5]
MHLDWRKATRGLLTLEHDNPFKGAVLETEDSIREAWRTTLNAPSVANLASMLFGVHSRTWRQPEPNFACADMIAALYPTS